jgi:hypothetical protein
MRRASAAAASPAVRAAGSAKSSANRVYAPKRVQSVPTARCCRVAKSLDQYVVVGVFLASRDFPQVVFWLPLLDEKGSFDSQPVPLKSLVAALSPKIMADRDRILLHLRVVQRIDADGKLHGAVRYPCTDIAACYHMGDNAFKWIQFQSAQCKNSPCAIKLRMRRVGAHALSQ